jgi:hypothetical protein
VLLAVKKITFIHQNLIESMLGVVNGVKFFFFFFLCDIFPTGKTRKFELLWYLQSVGILGGKPFQNFYTYYSSSIKFSCRCKLCCYTIIYLWWEGELFAKD